MRLARFIHRLGDVEMTREQSQKRIWFVLWLSIEPQCIRLRNSIDQRCVELYYSLTFGGF